MHGLGGLGFGMFYQGRTESRDVMQDYSVCHSSKKLLFPHVSIKLVPNTRINSSKFKI